MPPYSNAGNFLFGEILAVGIGCIEVSILDDGLGWSLLGGIFSTKRESLSAGSLGMEVSCLLVPSVITRLGSGGKKRLVVDNLVRLSKSSFP